MTKKYAFIFEKSPNDEVKLTYADEIKSDLTPSDFAQEVIEDFDVNTLSERVAICVTAEALDEAYKKAEEMYKTYRDEIK